MRYYNKVLICRVAFNNLKSFLEKKQASDQVFDEIQPATLNNHLKKLLPGLTAKVFRTFNASVILDNELKKNSPTKQDTIDAKNLFYQQANKQVAILCNHQKTLSKQQELGMERNDELITEMEQQLVFLQDLKSKLVAFGNVEVCVTIPENFTNLFKENEKDKITLTKCESKIASLEKKIATSRSKQLVKKDTATVALGTSKLNYLDPRITVAYCKRTEFPLSKVFSSTMITKFPWSLAAEENFDF